MAHEQIRFEKGRKRGFEETGDGGLGASLGGLRIPPSIDAHGKSPRDGGLFGRGRSAAPLRRGEIKNFAGGGCETPHTHRG